MMHYILIEDLAASPGRQNVVVVDVRPMGAYNSWILQREPRGGHIEGAVPFPLSWMDLSDPAVLAELLGKRGIQPDGDVVLYGYGCEDA